MNLSIEDKPSDVNLDIMGKYIRFKVICYLQEFPERVQLNEHFIFCAICLIDDDKFFSV